MATRKNSQLSQDNLMKTEPTESDSMKTKARQDRLLKELHIDGTGLKGLPPPRRESYRFEGAWYEREIDNVPSSEVENGETTSNTEAHPQVGRKRSRQDEEVSRSPKRHRISTPVESEGDKVAPATTQSNTRRRKRASDETAPAPIKRAKTARNADEVFREKCLRQYQQVKPATGSVQEDNIAHIVPFLRVMKQPSSKRIQRHFESTTFSDEQPPEAYILPSADAKRLLASNTSIRAPVFVPGGARPLFEPNSDIRPIQQVLEEWFIDEYEVLEVFGLTTENKYVKITELREHFLPSNSPVKEPWNLPDIPSPELQDQAVPDFIDSLNCRFLHETIRRILDNAEDNICQDSCPLRTIPTRCCDKHRLTLKDFTTFHDASKFWRGALMLADAGATTTGHWDQWGLSVVISCYEGQIGFCWQSHPTLSQRTQVHRDASIPSGKYLYTVLRPGDVVYMPPGTVHHVFREPKGKQTLAHSTTILRRNGLDEWLEILLLEATNAIEHWGQFKRDRYEVVVPVFCRWVGYLIGLARTEREVERFGGAEKVKRVKGLLKKLEVLGRTLVAMAAAGV